jgi:DNA polymerase III epsilon subunit-like protein
MIKYYICDTETTGLKAGYNEMTEIGIIRAEDRVQLWRQIKCTYPERANFDALAITKKTMSDLEKGYDPIDIIAEVEKFLNEDGLTPAHRCFVCHNVPFDRKFLHAFWDSCDQEFPAHLWLDTMSLAREYSKISGLEKDCKDKGLPKPKVNLHAACDMVGVKKISEAHNAKVDSRNTYLLHRNLVEDKKLDYLPFIKTAVHVVSVRATVPDDDDMVGLDMSLLDQ